MATVADATRAAPRHAVFHLGRFRGCARNVNDSPATNPKWRRSYTMRPRTLARKLPAVQIRSSQGLSKVDSQNFRQKSSLRPHLMLASGDGGQDFADSPLSHNGPPSPGVPFQLPIVAGLPIGGIGRDFCKRWMQPTRRCPSLRPHSAGFSRRCPRKCKCSAAARLLACVQSHGPQIAP